MPFKHKISVLMSVYNTPFRLIKRAIDSVLNQDFQDFELIVIDDGSNNNTHFDLMSYCILNENKITYLRHRNCSQAESINKGILFSKGEFITIIDGDDEYKSSHLSSCIASIDSYDLIASTSETIVDHEADYYVPDRFDKEKFVHVDDCILFATLFGKKDVFTKVRFSNMYGADAHFYERAEKEFKVEKFDLRTYIYHKNNPDSITVRLKNEILN
jgi:glycosyltransferase involved in cell wall biosynthesis